MKIYFLLFVCILFLSCGKEPHLYFPSSEILLGEVILGNNKEVKIPIVNKGKKDLIIKNVNSSCKCINIKFPKKEIVSGQEDYITMTFKSDEIGHHSEKIVIISNDPEVYKLIKIKVNVIK